MIIGSQEFQSLMQMGWVLICLMLKTKASVTEFTIILVCIVLAVILDILNPFANHKYDICGIRFDQAQAIAGQISTVHPCF